MKYAYKYPDYEGGFYYKSIENGNIITRDNELQICDIQQANFLRKGITVEEGNIIDVADNLCVIEKNGQAKILKKSLINSKLIEQEKIDYELEPDYSITGTFETPVGEVFAEAQPDKIRKALCQPDFIKSSKDYYLFQVREGNSLHKAEVRKSAVGTMIVENFITCNLKAPKQKTKLYKAFGTTIKVPKVPKIESGTEGNNLQVEGRRKAGAKYIERKLNPRATSSKNKYIYLYELPSGKRVWRDVEGKDVQSEPTEQTGQTISPEQKYSAFKINDRVFYGGKLAQVKDRSDNYLFLETEHNQVIQINIPEHLAELKRQSSWKVGDTISLPDGQLGTINHIGGNVILVKHGDGKHRFVKRRHEIEMHTPYETGQKKKFQLPRINDKELSVHDTVLQGYNTNEDFLINNYNYEDEPKYKMFVQSSLEGGFGKVSDLRFSKYINTGDTVRSVSRFYNPQWNEVQTFIDGIENYKIRFKGENYIVRDMDEEGLAVEDKEGNYFFIEHGEYKKAMDDEVGESTVENYYGDTLVIPKDKPKYKFSGQLSEEQKKRIEQIKPRANRFTKKGRQADEPIQSAEKKAQIEAEQEQIREGIKQTLNSQAYIDSSDKIQKRGFEIAENKFHAKKSVKIGDMSFDFVAQYNKEKQAFEPSLHKGTTDSVTIGQNKFKIFDITEYEGEKFIHYKDEQGNEESASLSTLEGLNGKRIFEPTDKAKGIVSSLKPQLIYFTPKEKELATWEVVELDDLAISHHLDGSLNNKYTIKEAQNRDRTSEQSKRQVMQIANDIGENFDTFLPSFSATVDYGAPVITKDYQVIAGNGRGLGIAQGYENNNVYKQKLLERAQDLGFNADEIAKMQKPVIVRKLAVEDKDRVHKLGVLSNAEQKLATTKTEAGKGKAVLIDDRLFNKIAEIFQKTKLPEGGTIREYLDETGAEIINEMVKKGVIAQNELPHYIDLRTNRLLPEHKDNIKNVIAQRLFGENGEHIDYVADATQKGITDAIGDIMSLKNKEGDISKPLGEALKVLRLYENNKANFKDNLKWFIEEESKNQLDPLKASPEALAIFETIANKKQTEVRDVFRKYKQAIEGDMFGAGMSPQEAFANSFKTQFPEGVNNR